MSNRPCPVCGAEERLLQTPRPVRDEEGKPVLVGWDERTQSPIPLMEPGPERLVVEHDSTKHGIRRPGYGPSIV